MKIHAVTSNVNVIDLNQHWKRESGGSTTEPPLFLYKYTLCAIRYDVLSVVTYYNIYIFRCIKSSL